MANRTIKINEASEQQIIQDILAESYYPAGEKVLAIKKYLDDNFRRCLADDVDDFGHPTKEQGFMRILGGEDIEPMKKEDVLLMLDDKFSGMISDEDDRRRFLKQVIKDWYNKKIDRNGVLSVNFV